MKECASRGDFDGANQLLRDIKALQLSLATNDFCSFCLMPRPFSTQSRRATVETWYPTKDDKWLCACCHACPRRSETVAAWHIEMNKSLALRVQKEVSAAMVYMPHFSENKMAELRKAIRQLPVEALGSGKGVRWNRPWPMDQHVLVGQLWRSVARIQLDPELHMFTKVVYQTLGYLGAV